MIEIILKKRYDDWIQAPVSHDPAEFIAAVATSHGTTVEIIGKLLEKCDWFIVP